MIRITKIVGSVFGSIIIGIPLFRNYRMQPLVGAKRLGLKAQGMCSSCFSNPMLSLCASSNSKNVNATRNKANRTRESDKRRETQPYVRVFDGAWDGTCLKQRGGQNFNFKIGSTLVLAAVKARSTWNAQAAVQFCKVLSAI